MILPVEAHGLWSFNKIDCRQQKKSIKLRKTITRRNFCSMHCHKHLRIWASETKKQLPVLRRWWINMQQGLISVSSWRIYAFPKLFIMFYQWLTHHWEPIKILSSCCIFIRNHQLRRLTHCLLSRVCVPVRVRVIVLNQSATASQYFYGLLIMSLAFMS